MEVWVSGVVDEIIYINTADDFVFYLGNGNKDNLGKSFLLTADIDLSDYCGVTDPWAPIENFSNPFIGEFDGGCCDS